MVSGQLLGILDSKFATSRNPAVVSDQPLGILEPSENRPQPTGSVEVLGHMSTKKMLSQQQISNFLCSLSVAFAATGRSIRSHRALPMSRWHSQPPGTALSSPVLRSYLFRSVPSSEAQLSFSHSFPCSETHLSLSLFPTQ